LHQILEAQNYRLSYWRMAARGLGYRRFFDISSLVGLRMENVQVFEATHATDSEVGSRGPPFRSQDRSSRRPARSARLPAASANRLSGYLDRSGEILSGAERLRDSWPIDGTTGYDFLNIVGRLLIDPAGAEPLTVLYREFSGETADFQSLVRVKKQLAMRGSLGSDINRLTA
jgi:(1->4)-alpha-D-glucan 1-alpha-D-glucosylmutase